MKKVLLSMSVFAAFTSFSQTFSDNFDSYTAGQYMAAQSGGDWTTWSNTPGTTEDVMVSSADAASMPNSVYFSTSSSTGGPTDLVKNFGVLNTGQFSLEFKMKVQSGKAGYFNLQQNATIGQVWAMDCFFGDNGTISLVNTGGLNLNAGSYPQNQWFDFRLDINFNTNEWKVFINNTEQASFANPYNQIASIDIFPVDQTSPYSCGYYIDDFEYTITPYTLPALNAGVTLVSFSEANLATVAVTPKVKVRNLGTTPITSFDLDVVYNGNTISKSVTGINLASLATTEITMDDDMILAAGNMNMTATVSNVNNGTDLDSDDNVGTLAIDPVVPAAGKMVVGEEGTGTWCQWCPRGAVFMDMMENKYEDFWAGIAVHNNDPMVVPHYDASFASYIAGYPSALVDRGNDIDPSEMEPAFLDRLVIAPKGLITNGATWNPATRELKVSMSVNFVAAAGSTYKAAIAITEDDVTGSTSSYNQQNAYAGGNNGVMGGYELLPSSVPAAQMVYDHVARQISPSMAGASNVFPTVVNAGETHTVNAVYILPANWDETQIHIIGLLIAPDGKIDNAGKATIAEAVSNGYVTGSGFLGTGEIDQIDALVQVYPNPASDQTNISVNLQEESNVSVRILDMSGKVYASRNYGSMNGANVINLNTSELAAGIYTIELVANDAVAQKRLVIEK